MAPVPSSARSAPTSKDRPDPRIHAYREDVADIALEGTVNAARFVEPEPHWLSGQPSRMMKLKPGRAEVAVSELLSGQQFDVLHADAGWAWGYSAHDHYVGYVEADALTPDRPFVTHRIAVPTALVFSRPDIKSDVPFMLPMNAEFAAEEFNEKFLRTSTGMFVHRRHAAEISAFETDHASVAAKLIGTPYKWGGRTCAGIDCSGLVQIALAACGITAPRDSDMQAGLGRAVEGAYQRGDIVVFPGHVGIMADEAHLLHANAYHMSTLVEPLAKVVDRLRPQYEQPITAVRRL